MKNKNLKEKQLYEVKYKNFFGSEKTIIGYLIEINIEGNFIFNSNIEGRVFYDSSRTIYQTDIIKIKELSRKGEAISLKAE